MVKNEEAKEWLDDAVSTDNPPGTDYYGAEADEIQLEAARERMEEALKAQDEAHKDAANVSLPSHPVRPERP